MRKVWNASYQSFDYKRLQDLVLDILWKNYCTQMQKDIFHILMFRIVASDNFYYLVPKILRVSQVPISLYNMQM